MSDTKPRASNLFDIVRHNKGKWNRKAYVIRSHGNNQIFDTAHYWPKEGAHLVQYDAHYGDNQLYHICPYPSV